MVNGLVVTNSKGAMIEVAPLLKVYEQVCGFQGTRGPTFQQIVNHYNCTVEAELANLKATIYGDEFYDGSSGSVPNMFPDSMKNELSERIGMNKDLTEDEIEEILNRFCLFYVMRGKPRNDPYVEVW